MYRSLFKPQNRNAPASITCLAPQPPFLHQLRQTVKLEFSLLNKTSLNVNSVKTSLSVNVDKSQYWGSVRPSSVCQDCDLDAKEWILEKSSGFHSLKSQYQSLGLGDSITVMPVWYSFWKGNRALARKFYTEIMYDFQVCFEPSNFIQK